MCGRIITQWEPENFRLETNTVWRFPNRGSWATHDGNYRGNWSPYVPRNLLLKYSNPEELVLDQFVGGGTTLVEAKLLNRHAIGIDVSNAALRRCKEKCDFNSDNNAKVYIRRGDARKLDFIPDESIDFICTHPPYANAIRYSDDIEGDISHCSVDEFLSAMYRVAEESVRVIKNGRHCAILIGDIRKRKHVIPLGFEVMKIFQTTGFKLMEVIVKEQFNCKSTELWKDKGNEFLMLAHEYLFIFEKSV